MNMTIGLEILYFAELSARPPKAVFLQRLKPFKVRSHIEEKITTATLRKVTVEIVLNQD